ncbi:polysaccharide lyase 6 family protein [Lutibacter flavus]|uniref:Poly(Beta-D-mannuronate) lyase n=1 Tax=Lutibacter flavus TaxID=691689 RepID=A0A238VES1_9FLAO|nr:polysaccharide lyase 6 family protein [Lutibacter flavus]SNR32900.1 poly(beta-D-mannuronate) lyase [Lutibacter flavus]
MHKIISSLLFLFLFQHIAISQNSLEIKVANITEFNEAIKKATPGTKIILKNGEWKDVHFKAFGIGTKEAPIIISAETNGEVIITGDSRLNIAGKNIIVSGLWFKDGTPTSKYLIEFRKDSKDFAYNCRLTNCTISNYNPSDNSIENHWVDIWGRNNRVDHNNFTGKTNGGTTLVVWLKGDAHIENNHLIDHNFFGNRPDLGENGGETIRIGTSTNSMKSSKTIVEFNTFKHCNGEIEIISNKSGDNIFRNNLFMESEGTLTLRHGNNALVENNVFIGNNKSKVGGIRIINEGHIVRNNLLVGILGDDYRGPIVVMNGVPNSPLNRYNQVKNVDIQNNTLINCSPIQFGAGKDSEKTLAPTNVVFANNLISNTNGGKISNEQDVVTGITFNGNIVDSEATVNPAQFTKATIDWAILKGLPMPTSANEILKTVNKTDKSPEFDITETKRVNYVAGAFNLDNTILPKVINAKSGPYWNPIIEQKVTPITETTVTIEPGIGTINKGIKKVGKKGTLVLNAGEYIVEKTMKINGDIIIKGNQGNGEVILKMSSTIEKPLTYFFRANEGARLQLENLTLNGEGKTAVKYAMVSPDENLNEKYSLFVDNCTLKNFTNSNGGAVFKAYVGTLADTISIKNSKIIDNYRGLNLSYEKVLFGKYNAEVIILYNTLFKNIEEFAINYASNGVNPINKGGQILVDQCVFSKIYNTEKGYLIKTKDINYVTIKNSVFENSYDVKTPINLNGTNHLISNCLVYACGVIKTSGQTTSQNIKYKSPKWEDSKLLIPREKSPLLKKNNGIGRIGLLEK